MGSEFYVIVKGKVGVYTNNKNGERVKLENVDLGPGNYFGEMALMMNVPRTATITATQDCLLLELKKMDFDNFLKCEPLLGRSFHSVVKARIVNMFKKFDIPFLDGVADERRTALAEMSSLLEYQPQDIVFNQDDEGDAFYIIVHGEVDVFRRYDEVGDTESRFVCTLGAGKVFGEIALVSDVPRTCTLTCKTRTLLLSVRRDDFKKYIEDDPQSFAELALRVCKQKVDFIHILHHPQCLEAFSKHLDLEYSGENLKFYHTVNGFHDFCRKCTTRRLKERANEISHQFITEDAPEQVNIPARQREDLLAVLASDSYDATVFDEAQEEVVKLMGADSFKRFKKTQQFLEILEALGCYKNEKPPEPSVSTKDISVRVDSEKAPTHFRKPSSPADSRRSSTGVELLGGA